MFFVLSKVIYFLITPSNFLIFCTLAGVGLAAATRLRRTGLGLAGFGAVGLAVGGLSPLSEMVLLPLEQRFPQYPADGPAPAGIVVLGGGIESGLSEARDQVIVNEAGERPIYFADLARRFPGARLVFSGGSGFVGGGVSEADIVSRHADVLGLPRSRLILENRSRNTHENAAFSAALVKPKPGERWLLVTSAWHMPRAMGCFREAGFTVDAFPVDYGTRGWRDVTRLHGFSSDGLLQLDLAVKEWVGLIAYRLAGYTPDWLPGPEAPSEAPMPADPPAGSASR
ncbi:YdcF family protein [Methylobacterium sp. NEAU 140]|uniref:YdcF family protein n=1 Tax=Methylobacterium sp. NEAU 140 TaxID=3064945 RepID=UPI002734A064|nr:YdcF family protein [Methylobacterium sp. NEAU 140]MDP4026177.1 YdcF family protein [Methylobacterium sp. NEAU 140]